MPACLRRCLSGAGVTAPVRLPGDGCRFWADGRCLYEELLNPGLRVEYGCVVLNGLEKNFDAFVMRGEKLGLTTEQAGRIWERRMDAALNIGWDCANFIFLQDGPGEMPCLHFRNGVCMLRLPACPGRCRRFVPHKRRRT